MPCQVPPRSNRMLSPGMNVCALSASKDCHAFVGDKPESASSPVGDMWYVCWARQERMQPTIPAQKTPTLISMAQQVELGDGEDSCF